MSIRKRLIVIFLLLELIPLAAISYLTLNQAAELGEYVSRLHAQLVDSFRGITQTTGERLVRDTERALDHRSRENIERLTTDTARQIAGILYRRDRDIQAAAALDPDLDSYRRFLAERRELLTEPPEFRLSEDGRQWLPVEPPAAEPPAVAAPPGVASLSDLNVRPPEVARRRRPAPLYLEMTFFDPQGREQLKVVESELMSDQTRDISQPANTFVRAERYFEQLASLEAGDIYVSDQIGGYVGSTFIGPYLPERLAQAGQVFQPEQAAYAGLENPVGRRYRGLIRWVTPVVRNGVKLGYVSLALDQRHLAEFTDYLVPTEQRYGSVPDPASGNYAFLLDHKGRTIHHPRHYHIVGYDPASGAPVAPWLDQQTYQAWQASGQPIDQFLAEQPAFRDQSLAVKPALAQLRAGTLAADCRHLNFAPQCSGWQQITEQGGSGSFRIFWAGLWKLNTVAVIPYYTGQYNSQRGFGYITIGTNSEQFHSAANRAGEQLLAELSVLRSATQGNLYQSQKQIEQSVGNLSVWLASALLVIIGLTTVAAFWLAWQLDHRLQPLIDGMRRFAGGETGRRIPVGSADELGQIAGAFNEMADTLVEREAELRKFAFATHQSPMVVMITGPDGRIQYTNEKFSETSGYSAAEVKGRKPSILRSGHTPDEEYRKLWQTLLSGEIWRGRFRNRHKDGSLYWEDAVIGPVMDDQGRVSHYIAVKEDITWRIEQEQHIHYLAFHDDLTGLPNRTLAMEQLEAAIKHAKRYRQSFAVMFIDLDDFKNVNDTLGHDAGDQLVVQAAERIRQRVRESDTVARLGGDEFLLIINDTQQAANAGMLAEQLLEQMRKPFLLGDYEVTVSACIGVALYSQHGDSKELLLKSADTAMYAAKNAGKNTWRLFRDEMKGHMDERFDLEQKLRRALANNELSLHYQPIVDVRQRKLLSVEVLLRWFTDAGPVSPTDFIPVAEQTGIINEIDRWLVAEVFRQVTSWEAQGYREFQVSINVSPRQLVSGAFLEQLKHNLAHYQLPPQRFIIEVTEGVLISDPVRAREMLEELRALDIAIAIDDFGTGYSSLGYLKHYPFNILKIDREFVRDLGDDPDDETLVTAIVALGNNLKLRVVAEGVETVEQLHFLQRAGCHAVQGYLTGRPQPAYELAGLLACGALLDGVEDYCQRQVDMVAD
ncbi:putative bifunctional diguanylate cyclase/phosphodiesterase [Marinobacterium arenosum]|uniref:putative bifunctional diguanylate cyclase/phosphodiesterase n=1 Tax=Marinobacterium arenosum TaxID=2862496 RepID=UPI001C97C404|nr:EAL domain-containing protein [Marinobacterium arenosum]MBY4676955.1 EAL domain-containing protein [Marinobacterium arenosum]